MVGLPTGLDRGVRPEQRQRLRRRKTRLSETDAQGVRSHPEGERAELHARLIFALAYTRITQTYGWSRDIPGYYQDVPYINHMDAVFAKYYTDAYYAYKAGNRRPSPAPG